MALSNVFTTVFITFSCILEAGVELLFAGVNVIIKYLIFLFRSNFNIQFARQVMFFHELLESKSSHQLSLVIGSLVAGECIFRQTDITLYVLVPEILLLSFTSESICIFDKMCLGLEVGNWWFRYP